MKTILNFTQPSTHQEARDQRKVVATMRNVTITFDSYLTRALANVSLEVRRGEVFGLSGAAGSGKSIALQILAGVLRPIEGQVRVFGRPPTSRFVRARIGYLPGEAAKNRPRGLARFKAILGRILPGSAKRKRATSGNPAEKSRRRSELAAAIRGSRELVVLDDPFADLDHSEACEVKELVCKIAGEGRTVILSGRGIAELSDVCDRIAVLYGGRLEAVGTFDQLLASTQALRFLAPVLSRDVSERVLSALRVELRTDLADGHLPAPRSNKESKRAEEGSSDAAASRDECDAGDVLDSLVEPKSESQMVVRIPTPQPAGEPNRDDAVDHEKLAGLTKPESEPPRKN